VAIIIAAAIVSSIVSYAYTTSNAAQIENIASEESRTDAKLQARDLSLLLTSQIDSISDNLETIAAANSVVNQDVPRATPLLNTGQKSTSELTAGYSWLDKDGRLLYSTSWASNATLRDQFEGLDLSFREYYTQPK